MRNHYNFLVLFRLLQCPVLVAWGDKDPWEPVELGKLYAEFGVVEDFVILPDVGHCPQVLHRLSVALNLSLLTTSSLTTIFFFAG